MPEQGSPQGWLGDAVIYEIYPQSFADSNGDGIGDLPGALAKLDYLQWLGVDTIWFNPCFVSPFVDAGYDVADYLQVAPRYGGNEALAAFVDEARRRGIRVLLDLVAGHTSDQHEWFIEESNRLVQGNPPSVTEPLADRYIWTQRAPRGETGALASDVWVPSPGWRPGFFMKNFYDQQPALNFGYARPHPQQPWRQPVDAPGPQLNRQALRDILDFWLSRGVAGFRVDMAFSLVKDDPDSRETMRLWAEIRRWLDNEHPEAVLIPEGTEPRTAASSSSGDPAAFSADFMLVIGAEHRALFNNQGAGQLPWHDGKPCYFDAAGQGEEALSEFLALWQQHRQRDPERLAVMASADHDFSRVVCGDRDATQARVALMFLFTWGTVPSLYYGDEIGMRYLPGLPNKEGSACFPDHYNRAGARTPMQWDDRPNAGFSTAPADALYLPIDPIPGRPTVAGQREDPESLLHFVRALIAEHRRLSGSAPPEVLHAGYPLVFTRGDTVVVLNPAGRQVTAQLHSRGDWVPRLERGVTCIGDTVVCEPFAYGLFTTTAISATLGS